MFKAIIKEAWISIAAYKLRTFLTMLGIMIGVAAVVMMVSAGQAVQAYITKSFESMGSNLIVIVVQVSYFTVSSLLHSFSTL